MAGGVLAVVLVLRRVGANVAGNLGEFGAGHGVVLFFGEASAPLTGDTIRTEYVLVKGLCDSFFLPANLLAHELLEELREREPALAGEPLGLGTELGVEREGETRFAPALVGGVHDNPRPRRSAVSS